MQHMYYGTCVGQDQVIAMLRESSQPQWRTCFLESVNDNTAYQSTAVMEIHPGLIK